MNKKPISTAISTHGVTRRTLLEGAACLGVVALVSPFNVIADGRASQGKEVFVAVSKRLTEYDDLNSVLAERFYAALQGLNPKFSTELAALAKEMAKSDAKTLAKSLSPSAQKTAKSIISAWYTGIVGEGTTAQVITYRHALEFKAVDDVLQIRTYCPNKPGYWAEKPIERKS